MQNGHKYADRDIKAGELVIKYGQPIGHATEDIQKGEHVHTHNLRTNLSGKLSYEYTEGERRASGAECTETFLGYLRESGEIGIRNDVWIVNTVGCVNAIAERLAALTGAKCFPHPYGCSQLGGDHILTQRVLCGLIKHPNAGGVLVLGLGCENNGIEAMKRALGSWNEKRVRFLNVQDCEDEIAQGVRLIEELIAYTKTEKRVPVPLSRLRLGLKCGGSDGLSGITANPMVGKISDRLCAMGGSCVLTEVPEMFGAEHLLMARAESRDVFARTVDLINDFKAYYERHGQVIYENPSPGNKAGGITTLEEKSLGCILKGGESPVVDVLHIGEEVRRSGLSLLDGPGNDLVALTNLVASGVHMILFTTGRGTPLGAPVPTVKISTNRALARKKPHWIDFDAESGDAEALWRLIVSVANGAKTKNEENKDEQIAIFKDGVTL